MPIGPVQDLTVAVDEPGAWLIANQTIDRNGQAQTTCRRGSPAAFPRPPAWAERRSDPALLQAPAREGYRQRVTSMPASRYWTLQAIETADLPRPRRLLLAPARFWWLRHRVV